MIIELNGNREDKPLCHVAMVANFWFSAQLCSCKYGRKNKKKWHVWLSSAWLHCHTGINKTVTKQDTGRTQQRKNDQTSRCGAHVLTEQWRFQRRGAAPLVLDESRGPHGWGKLILRFGNFFLNPPHPDPLTSRSESATAVMPLFPMKSRGEEWRHAHHHGSTISGWQQNQRRRRRKENGKKVKGFCWQNSKFPRASRYFVHFFPVVELLRPETS